MKKMLVALVIVVVIFGGFLYVRYLEDQRERIRDILEQKYGAVIDGPGYEDPCTVCTESGCESLGEGCWKANVTSDDLLLEVAVDVQGSILEESEGAGPGGDDSPSQPAPPTACQYQYIEVQGSESIVYTNTGCENPAPVCSTGNDCIPCVTDSDCIGMIQTSSGTPITTVLHITSTQYDGNYVYATGNCTIDDSVITVYDNVTNYEECLAVVTSHVQCSAGSCDFI